MWFFGTYRKQFNAVAQPSFQFDKTFDTLLWNAVGKATYQVNAKNKLIGYYQWGQKEQPNRLPDGAYTYASPEQTLSQLSGSWVYKAEWNSTISDKVYLEARYGDFGYYFPLTTNSPDNFFIQDTGRLIMEGAHQKQQLDRDRKQYNLASTYFLDTAKGSHTFKMGAEIQQERSWEGFESRRGGDSNIELRFNNNNATQVIFGIPTANCEVGSLDAHDCLTSQAALNTIGLFLTDTWSLGKMTLNAGVRYDRYKGWLPEQEQLGATTGPVVVTAQTFAERDLFTWNSFAPRLGMVYDLFGTGKTVLKAQLRPLLAQPGRHASPATPTGTPPASRRPTPGPTSTAIAAGRTVNRRPSLTTADLAGSIGIDPNIKDPYTHEVSAWVEQQLTDTMGLRAGFVYKTEDDLIAQIQPGTPASVFTTPYTFVDVGVDGRAGTADDRNLTFYGIPNATYATLDRSVIQSNTDQFARYKTVEASVNRRYSNKWSASFGGSYTMLHDFFNGRPQDTPNNPGVGDRSTWNFKATGVVRRAVGHPPLAGVPSPVGRQLRAHADHLGAGGAWA